MAAEICAEVGRVIASRRRRKGISQTVLAGLAGISRVHLSELERGKKEMSIVTLKNIADALAISPGDLFPSDQRAKTRRTLKTKIA